MASKLQEYRRMSEEAQRQLTGSLERWQSFLATASRLYKYPYHEQVMIHAQRPDATACAEFDVWNNTMRRYVRRGSKGIALIDTSGDRERLRYFINANSTTAPQIVDRAVKPILDRGEVYSGCYARVSLNFYAFNSNGNKGIACGLGNIQKIRDGESLGGKTSATDDFGTVADDDFLA